MTRPAWMRDRGVCPRCGARAVLLVVSGTRRHKGKLVPRTVRQCQARAVDRAGDLRWCKWTDGVSRERH